MANAGALAGKDNELAQLRFVDGLPTRAIAERFGVSHVAVHYWEKKFISQHPAAEADTLRAYANSQLDEMISSLMDDFRAAEESGNLAKKIEISKAVVNIQQRQAALNGLDKSVSIHANFNFDGGVIPVKAVDYRQDLDALKPANYQAPQIVEVSDDE